MTNSPQPVRSRQRGRTGYLSLQLPRDTADNDVPVLLGQLVTEELTEFGEQLASLEIITNQRSEQGPMKRWFVEYVTAPSS
jgi:hypothetical protein